MKSTAHIKGHPIHPILICFPLAFLIGSWVFDLINIFSASDDFATTGRYLNIAGIASGLLAAIPGIIDYSSTIPKNSSAKKRGATHGLLNTSAIILFSIALYFRYNNSPDYYLIAGIGTIGVILLFISGWLGGTLVYRNQIGVDIRYADAGKWSEQKTTAINGLAEIKDIEKLLVNQMKLVHVGNKRIVIARTETQYVAFDDRCTHRGASLAGGAMICGTVQCPWHGSQFDVTNGGVKAGPAKESIHCYEVIHENDRYFIRVNS